MKITICGSIYFLNEIKELDVKLRFMGFEDVFRPHGVVGNEKNYKDNATVEEDSKKKIELDLIRGHWNRILQSDCILIANYSKKCVDGYIGGNSFLEMGFGFVTGKPIFLLNPIPEMPYSSEIEAMKPIIINNDLHKILEYYNLNSQSYGTSSNYK